MKSRLIFILSFTLVLLVPLLLVVTPAVSSSRAGEITITFVNVGQGDATLIQDSAGFDILIDGGNKTAGLQVLDTIRDLAVDDLDVVIATHADRDHIGGLITILESDEIQIEQIYFNGYPGDTLTWQEFELAAAADGLTLIPLQYPAVQQWGEFDFEVLNPAQNLVDPEQNDASVVLLVDYAQTSVLFPADIDSTAEQLLPARTSSLLVDVLKVAHHGSKFSSSPEFLQAAMPTDAVISVGNNAYGHPTLETLQRLAAIGATIWRTDLLGNITLISDGNNYQLLPRTTFLPLIFLFPVSSSS